MQIPYSYKTDHPLKFWLSQVGTDDNNSVVKPSVKPGAYLAVDTSDINTALTFFPPAYRQVFWLLSDVCEAFTVLHIGFGYIATAD